jgi:TatD DNase family protein
VRGLPPLDIHAHLDSTISTEELDKLHAVIFAVTRSLQESQIAIKRTDKTTVWGLGCHPNLLRAHKGFDTPALLNMLDETAFVGEVGLDGKSHVDMPIQLNSLRMILGAIKDRPRIVTLHSSSAIDELLAILESNPIKSPILHWWLGDYRQTMKAISLGCYFSVNVSSAYSQTMQYIPQELVLAETDHPFGDRKSISPRRPGNVAQVEKMLAAHYKTTEAAMRRRVWQNFAVLVKDVGCYKLLPPKVRAILATVA